MSSTDSDNQINESIVPALILSLLSLSIGVILWKYIWINQFSLELPNPTSYINNNGSDQPTIIYLKSLIQTIKTYWPIYIQFDPEYYVKVCGLDAYTYLLFQRTIIKICILYCLLAIILGLPIEFPEYGKSFMSFMWINNYDNTLFGFFHLCLLFYIVGIYTHNIIRLRNKLQAVFVNIYTNSKEQLLIRTVVVSGLDKRDLQGVTVEKVIRNFLDTVLHDYFFQNYQADEIVEIIIVNDLSKLTQLESQKKEIEFALELHQKTNIKKYFIPKRLSSFNSAEKELQNIENQILESLYEFPTSSGNAFLCFNTLRTTKLCIERFSLGSVGKLRLYWNSILERFATKNQNKIRKLSKTLGKIHEEQEKAGSKKSLIQF